jgi:hypothetical protein
MRKPAHRMKRESQRELGFTWRWRVIGASTMVIVNLFLLT